MLFFKLQYHLKISKFKIFFKKSLNNNVLIFGMDVANNSMILNQIIM